MKDKIKYYIAIGAFISAIVIGFMALWIPPMGVIDPSVLWFTAQLLVFVSGILGFNLKYDSLSQTAEHRQNDKDDSVA